MNLYIGPKEVVETESRPDRDLLTLASLTQDTELLARFEHPQPPYLLKTPLI